MKHRQFQRFPAQYGSGIERTAPLLYRIRDAATAAWRSAHRRADVAMDNVPAIENQLRALQSICRVQWTSTGITCGAPAVAVAEVHAIDECNQVGLTPDGALVHTLCQACLSTARWATTIYVDRTRELESRRDTQPVCTTCGRPTRYLRSVFAVSPIGPEPLAS